MFFAELKTISENILKRLELFIVGKVVLGETLQISQFIHQRRWSWSRQNSINES